MMLFHTSVLRHPTARSLYAAWLELKDCAVGIPPTVAEQLAPTSAGAIGSGRNLAGTLLDYHGAHGATPTTRRLAEESWWWTVWNDASSPYVAIEFTRTDSDHVAQLLDGIDPRGFPGCRPDEVRRSAEARIVCETIACEAWLCLRTDMRVIDHVEINRWAVEAGHRNEDTSDLLLDDAGPCPWSSGRTSPRTSSAGSRPGCSPAGRKTTTRRRPTCCGTRTATSV